mgnify:FL=1
MNDTLGHETTETLKITVNEPSGSSDGGGPAPDPTLIFVIAGVVGGVGAAGAVGGVVLMRKRKVNTEIESGWAIKIFGPINPVILASLSADILTPTNLIVAALVIKQLQLQDSLGDFHRLVQCTD